ncbi:MAG: hypothetical protein LBB85_01565 [Dysgonamonadaceae bacterium]|jgi:hypothetical protein|nr:hypothetical protein [Dysgonamonadaceae bacterium]
MWSNWQEKVKPDAQIPKHLLWDMDLKKFDMQKGRSIVVERVAERGKLEDFYTLFSMYGGVEGVREIIKNEVYELPPRAMSFVCAAFDLKMEDLKCYKLRRSPVIPWNS